MKKRLLFTTAMICGLCLFSAGSKECGKVLNGKVLIEAAAKKTSSEKKAESKESDAPTEFSLIRVLLFQTT